MANKVYKNGKVHPTLAAEDHLSLFLPAAILTLAASLPLRDKEVLAYFLSCSGGNGGVDLVAARPSAKELRGREDHAPQFECACFRCYVSFWSRWDSSPNRHVIDEIIEAFEEHERREASQRRVRKGRKEWKKRGRGRGRGGDEATSRGAACDCGVATETVEVAGENEREEEEEERGLVRRIGTTMGIKIWNFFDRITM